MNKSSKVIFIILGIIILLVFLYPKDSGHSYAGKVPVGTILTRIEYSCFGIEYARNGDRWGMYQITDGGAYYYCIGIPHSPKCYERISGTGLETEKQVSCKK